ncbi:MAG: tetratricopeptide repeat protein, partial [bacterium]
IGIEGKVETLDLSERLGLVLQAAAGSVADTQAAYAEAQSLYEAGLYEESAARFRGVLKFDRRNVGAWQYLGGALYALGRLPEALEAYEQALALNPGDEAFLSWVAELRQTVASSALPAPAGEV